MSSLAEKGSSYPQIYDHLVRGGSHPKCAVCDGSKKAAQGLPLNLGPPGQAGA
jgi:hypothetical protein